MEPGHQLLHLRRANARLWVAGNKVRLAFGELIRRVVQGPPVNHGRAIAR